jgi:hypothetical protein
MWGRIVLVGAALLALVGCRPAAAQDRTTVAVACNLGWEQEATPDLAGFRLYKATASGAFVRGGQERTIGAAPVAVKTAFPSTCADFNITQGGTYYVTVTAVDRVGNESPFATEMVLDIDASAPGSPVNLRLTGFQIKGLIVERSVRDALEGRERDAPALAAPEPPAPEPKPAKPARKRKQKTPTAPKSIFQPPAVEEPPACGPGCVPAPQLAPQMVPQAAPPAPAPAIGTALDRRQVWNHFIP